MNTITRPLARGRVRRLFALPFAALALASCAEPKRIVTALKPPAERLQCAPAGERPMIPPEYQIDWTAALTSSNAREAVARAVVQHDAYVRSVRAREGVVAGYIISVEGKLFACASNAQWLREWFDATSR